MPGLELRRRIGGTYAALKHAATSFGQWWFSELAGFVPEPVKRFFGDPAPTERLYYDGSASNGSDASTDLPDADAKTSIGAVVVLPYRQQVLQHPKWQAPQQYLQNKCAADLLPRNKRKKAICKACCCARWGLIPRWR